MKTFLVVPPEIGRQAVFGLGDIPVVMKIDFLLFDRPPEAFHEDIVQGSASAIHADPDGMRFQEIDEDLGRILGPLIGIEDLGNGLHQDPGEGGAAEFRVHGHRNLPIQDVARVPVDDGREIDKPLLETDVRDIRTEDLIGADNGHILQKIGVDLMLLVSLRQGGLGIDCLQTHQAHQAKDPFGIDGMSLGSEPGRHPPVSIDRSSRVLFVDQTHENLGQGIEFPRPVIPAGATEAKKITLTLQADMRMSEVHESPLLIQARRHFFFSQSTSTLSWPIS